MEKRLWFKAKHYGWGWTPATWEGWVLTLGFILYIIYRTAIVSAMFDTTTSAGFRIFFEVAVPTAILIAICFWKGEKPRWRWGGK